MHRWKFCLFKKKKIVQCLIKKKKKLIDCFYFCRAVAKWLSPTCLFWWHISVSSQSSVYIWVVAKKDGEEKIMLSGTLGGSSLKLKWAWITHFAISPEAALKLILSSSSSENDKRGSWIWFKCLLLCDWQEILFTVSAKQNHFHRKTGKTRTVPIHAHFYQWTTSQLKQQLLSSWSRLNALMEHCHCQLFSHSVVFFYVVFFVQGISQQHWIISQAADYSDMLMLLFFNTPKVLYLYV